MELDERRKGGWGAVSVFETFLYLTDKITIELYKT
jgi:hypothetical protein